MDAPLYEQIYNYIFNKIKTGELNSGDRVSSEKELADHFKVSRITSKKALELLSDNKLIERIQGKGSFVLECLPDLSLKEGNIRETGHDRNQHEMSNKLLGLIMPDFSDSYGTGLIHGIEEACSENNCQMLMKLTLDKSEEEEAAIKTFLNLGVDGLIIFSVHGEHYNAELLRLVLGKFPVVFVDRYLKGLAACSVYTDNRKAAHEITKYLLDQGHVQIGFLSTPSEHTSAIEDRISGFMDALAEGGQVFKPHLLMSNLYSSLPLLTSEKNIKADMERVNSFVKKNPDITAFVCSEYNLALLLREVLHSSGKRIPEDSAIVCFDSPTDPFGRPYFTHIHQNEELMGKKAVELLVEQWMSKEIPIHNTIPYELVKGVSTH